MRKLPLKETNLFLTAVALAVFASIPAVAQVQRTPIPEQPSLAPQIEIDGSGIATVEGRFPANSLPGGGKVSAGRINCSDSSLVIGASQQLYRDGGIGSLVLGVTTSDNSLNSSGTGLFLHQAYLDYSTKPFEAVLGRTDVPTLIVTFPTLRGDDLVEFTGVVNPFSSGGNVQEHRYSNQVALTFNKGLRYFLNVHAQHLIDSTGSGGDQTGINSYGITFTYQGAPVLANMERVPEWGLGVEEQQIAGSSGGADTALYGGVVYNIKTDPIDRFDVRFQDTYTTGNTLKAFTSVADTYRAAANSAAMSLRYLHSPFGRPAYQVALTLGLRTYQNVPNSSTFAIALTGVKRLGEGFDLVAQYTYQHRASTSAALFGGQDNNAVQIGFAYNFTDTFNRHIAPRRSLLSLQHQYIPE
jgi:hypothetical protein